MQPTPEQVEARRVLVQAMCDAYGEKGCDDEDEIGSSVYLPSIDAALDAVYRHPDLLRAAAAVSPPTEPTEPSEPSEAGIEAAARAYYEWATMNEGEESRWDEPGLHQGFARARAEVIVGAYLAAIRGGTP